MQSMYRYPMFLTCVWLLLPLTAAAQEYQLEPLGALPGSVSSIPWGINENGAIVGTSIESSGTNRAFLWTQQGGMVEIMAPGNHTFSGAKDINDAGVIVGTSKVNATDLQGHAWWWDGGMTTLVPKPFTYVFSEAWAINNNNVVGGDIYKASIGQVYGYFWSPQNGMQVIGAQYTHVRDINNLGQMVGYKPTSGASHTIRWNADGTMIDLVANNGFVHCYGSAINDSGQMAGRMTSVSGDNVGLFRYTDGVGLVYLGGVGPIGAAWDINEFGDVVGATNIDGTPGQFGAVVYTDESGLRYLEPLIDQQGWVLTGAYALNNKGQIVATGSKDGGPEQAVRLLPIETPLPPLCTGNEQLRARCTLSPCGNRIDAFVTKAVPDSPITLQLDGVPTTAVPTSPMGWMSQQWCGVTSGKHEVKLAACGVRARVVCP